MVTSVRGSGKAPSSAASVLVGVIGFMNAALGVRAVFGFAAFLAGAAFLATAFLAGAAFLAAAFLAGAAFFATGFAAFLAAGFAAGFFAAAFFAAGFLAADLAAFLAVAIFKPPSLKCWEIAPYHAPLIVVGF